jgi:hypothetical protein
VCLCVCACHAQRGGCARRRQWRMHRVRPATESWTGAAGRHHSQPRAVAQGRAPAYAPAAAAAPARGQAHAVPAMQDMAAIHRHTHTSTQADRYASVRVERGGYATVKKAYMHMSACPLCACGPCIGTHAHTHMGAYPLYAYGPYIRTRAHTHMGACPLYACGPCIGTHAHTHMGAYPLYACGPDIGTHAHSHMGAYPLYACGPDIGTHACGVHPAGRVDGTMHFSSH